MMSLSSAVSSSSSSAATTSATTTTRPTSHKSKKRTALSSDDDGDRQEATTSASSRQKPKAKKLKTKPSKPSNSDSDESDDEACKTPKSGKRANRITATEVETGSFDQFWSKATTVQKQVALRMIRDAEMYSYNTLIRNVCREDGNTDIIPSFYPRLGRLWEATQENTLLESDADAASETYYRNPRKKLAQRLHLQEHNAERRVVS